MDHSDRLLDVIIHFRGNEEKKWRNRIKRIAKKLGESYIWWEILVQESHGRSFPTVIFFHLLSHLFCGGSCYVDCSHWLSNKGMWATMGTYSILLLNLQLSLILGAWVSLLGLKHRENYSKNWKTLKVPRHLRPHLSCGP